MNMVFPDHIQNAAFDKDYATNQKDTHIQTHEHQNYYKYSDNLAKDLVSMCIKNNRTFSFGGHF